MSSQSIAIEKIPTLTNKIVAGLAIAVGVFITLFLINIFESKFSDSEPAKVIKTQLTDYATKLESAQKVGDSAAAIELLNPTTNLLNEYNNMSEVKKEKIQNSDLRYCHLALINLSDGIVEVSKGGYWLKKEQFDNALNMCH